MSLAQKISSTNAESLYRAAGGIQQLRDQLGATESSITPPSSSLVRSKT